MNLDVCCFCNKIEHEDNIRHGILKGTSLQLELCEKCINLYKIIVYDIDNKELYLTLDYLSPADIEWFGEYDYIFRFNKKLIEKVKYDLGQKLIKKENYYHNLVQNLRLEDKI